MNCKHAIHRHPVDQGLILRAATPARKCFTLARMSINRVQWITVLLLGAAVLSLAACKSGQKAANDPAPVAADESADTDQAQAPVEAKPQKATKTEPLSPDDFIVDTHRANQGGVIATSGLSASDVPRVKPANSDSPRFTRSASRRARANSSSKQSSTTLSATTAYAIEAMVGQVNGRPLYSSEVFEPMHEQLKRLGETLSPSEFRRNAGALIAKRLEQQITDSLILGEAEQQLTPEQNYGLLQYLKERRQELVRSIGRGSVALTEGTLRETSGITLDQKMERTRQQVIVQSYLRDKLLPKVNVTRKDIERYYRRHEKEFNPPPGRTVHMIQTRKKSTADKIDLDLVEGKPFLELAADENLNDYEPKKQGEFAKAVTGDNIFGPAHLNEAVLKLQQGEHTERLELKKGSRRYLWIYLKTLSTGKGITLREAQTQIEEKLRQQQFSKLTEQYQDRLFENGSFNSIEQMMRKLLDIAINKYARAS